jgi:hypothetical protein
LPAFHGYVDILGVQLDREAHAPGQFRGRAGAAFGLNISASAFFGKIYGDSSKIAGQTVNVNLGLGPFGYTRIYDPATGQLLGWTIGVGARLPVPPVSTSVSYDVTGVCSSRLGCTVGGPPPATSWLSFHGTSREPTWGKRRSRSNRRRLPRTIP